MYLKLSDGSRLFYEIFGEKGNPAVLLLHGIGADHRMWKLQVKKYAKEGYFVIAPDLRGHGKSVRPAKLTLDDWCSDILQLMDHYCIAECNIIGVSMGGVIALKFAVQYPNRLMKLVLCDTFGEVKSFTEKIGAYGQLLSFRLFKMFNLKKSRFAKIMSSTYKAPYASIAKDYFYEVSKMADYDQLIMARNAINKIDILGELPRVSCPSLILVGDKFGKGFIKANHKLHKRLPKSEFIVIKNSMDPSNLVNPHEFDNNVLAFLKGRGASIK